MCLQYSENISHPEMDLTWPLNEYVYLIRENGHHTKLDNINELKYNIIQDSQMPQTPDLGQAQCNTYICQHKNDNMSNISKTFIS